ncbi:hypothetical protein C0J52_07528 [Blattella germanica]|nr:hypothetical protein C0J52_07528 [Blattella germanica]
MTENKKREYLKEKINDLETNARNRNIRELYQGIRIERNGFQARTNIIKNENGGMLADANNYQEPIDFQLSSGEIFPVFIRPLDTQFITVRILNLPPEIPNSTLQNVLSQYGTVQEIRNEKWSSQSIVIVVDSLLDERVLSRSEHLVTYLRLQPTLFNDQQINQKATMKTTTADLKVVLLENGFSNL